MKRILTTGILSIDKDKFIPCGENNETVINKPQSGTCLWGSTMIKEPGGNVHSEWSDFTETNYTNACCNYGVSYKLNRSARIIEIGSSDDYRDIMRTYSCDRSSLYVDIGQTSIDFYKLSKDYDAFHLTSDDFWSMRYVDMRKHCYTGFYWYDCESWIIFNLECINMGSIINHDNVHM